MRVNYAGQLGQAKSTLNPDVVTTMTGALTLQGNPTGPLEAAPKQYVDSVATNLDATSIKENTIPVSRFPAFTGEVTSATGTGVFNLSNTGITAGTYSKVTVNAKGRVIGTSSLTNEDIPVFNWDKVVSDKPTTLSGYGITDGVNKDGGTLTGIVSLNNDPVEALDAVNKQYVDSVASSSGGLETGDVIRRTSGDSITGFLRCNGGEVSKADYAALYAVVGDTYSFELQPGSGQPWRQQYAINSEQSGNISGWTTGTELPGTVAYSQAVVTKNRVYLLGGQGGVGESSTVYTAPINTDGTLGSWVTSTALPVPVSQSQAVVTKNRVYLIGGYTDTGWSSTVYTASINSDGTLGSWTTGTALPTKVANSQAVVTKNRVYLLGGGASISSTVYTAPINADGGLGSWTISTALPEAVSASQAVVTKNRVYLLGGRINGGSYSSTVYTAPINTDGTLGSWATGAALPGTVGDSQAVVTKNRVYLLGGFNGSWSSTVYTALINADGTLGGWTTSAALPGTVGYSHAVVTKNRVYLLGGVITGNYSPTVYTAPILGGLNDYSPYYDGTFTPTDPVKFRLPDLSNQESTNEYYFIKT